MSLEIFNEILRLYLRTDVEHAWPLKFSVLGQPDIPCAMP